MNLISAAETRSRSPLSDEAYKARHQELPSVVPPGWLLLGLWGTLFGTILLAGAVLLSPMDEFVSAAGIVRPGNFTLVFSRAAGILESLDVGDGEHVQKGQVLASLESGEQRRQLQRLQQEMAVAEIELAVARDAARKIAAAPLPPEFLFSGVEMDRQREVQNLLRSYLTRLEVLEKSGSASVGELLNLRLQLIATEALLKRSEQAFDLLEGDFGRATEAEARDRVRLIETRLRGLQEEAAYQEAELGRRTITAPSEGVVLATSSSYPGERIEAGFALFQIAKGKQKQLRLYATEDRIDRVHPGQLVRFRANNNPDRLAPMATGRVMEITRDLDLSDAANAGNRRHLGEIYRVQVAVESEPYPLAVGASVLAEIVLGRQPFWRLLLEGRQNEVATGD